MTKAAAERRVLIVPGIGNSGPAHWQTLWQARSPRFTRVEQRDWDHPVRDEWTRALERDVARSGAATIIVAHSLGCLAVVHWAATTSASIEGALLVAVPDPSGKNFPAEAQGFEATPRSKLRFPSIVVASTNDPYAEIEFAARCAADWGSKLVNIGAAGHINAASGLGEWPAGYSLLDAL